MKNLLLALTCFLAAHQAFAKFTIGTFNVRNFDYDERERIKTDKVQLAGLLKALKVDFLGLNEIDNKQEFEKLVATQLPGYEVKLSECGGAHGQHVGFLYNTSVVKFVSFKEDLTVSDPGGTSGGCYAGSRPLGIGEFQFVGSNEKFFALIAHTKSGGQTSSIQKRQRQYEIIGNVAAGLMKTNKNVLIMGDLNSTGFLDKQEDYKNLTALTQKTGIINLSAKTACSAYWWGGTEDGIETPSLLDHVMASPNMIKTSVTQTTLFSHCAALACKESPIAALGVTYKTVSDHCPQTATIR